MSYESLFGMRSMAAWLLMFLMVILAQRAAELLLSRRNSQWLREDGGKEHAAGHFPLLVLVHVLFPVALVLEVVLLGARPSAWWPLWLLVWAAAQWLRYAAVQALGWRWTAGIWVLPGAPLVRSGPYAHLRHPNYLAVILELFTAPMIFGAWRTAIGISLLNLIALRIRIRAEERALSSSAAAPEQMKAGSAWRENPTNDSPRGW